MSEACTKPDTYSAGAQVGNMCMPLLLSDLCSDEYYGRLHSHR